MNKTEYRISILLMVIVLITLLILNHQTNEKVATMRQNSAQMHAKLNELNQRADALEYELESVVVPQITDKMIWVYENREVLNGNND
jgi:D-alanyl-D-alanine carboxypeptidase